MIGKMKLFIVGLLATFSLSLAFAPSASAAFSLFGDACRGVSDSAVCKDSKNSSNPIYGPNGIVGTVVNILSIIVGVAAVIVIIIAGIQYMLSTGDPSKVNNAKNAILYAVVGLIIAVLSQVIVKFIISRIG